MSSDECTSAVSGIQGDVSTCQSEISVFQDSVSQSKSIIDNIIEEGDSFVSFDGSSNVPGESYSDKFSYLQDSSNNPASDYTGSYGFGVVNYKYAQTYGSVNGIYNYYHDGIQNQLITLQGYLEAMESQVDTLNSNLADIYDVTTTLNCEACNFQSDDDFNGGGGDGGGSSGGGGDGGGSSGSGDCPCAALINALKAEVETIKDNVEQIRNSIDDNIVATLEELKEIFTRWDDYVEEDFKVKFENISTIVSSQSKFWQDYTNASYMVNNYGSSLDWIETGRTISKINNAGSSTVINVNEYKSLNYLQRIEYLLGSIAGIFSPTGSLAVSDFTQDQKGDISNTKNQSDSAFDQLATPKDYLETMITTFSEVQSKLNPFSGVFPNSFNVTQITLLPDVSVQSPLLQNTFHQITIDLEETGSGSLSISSIVQFCHVFTRFLWFVFFLLVDVAAIFWFVKSLIAIHKWYFNIYNSWFRTTFN